MTPRLTIMPHLRWIVFDVYGTLLTSSAGEIGCSEQISSRSSDSFKRIAETYCPAGTNPQDLEDFFHNHITQLHDQLHSDTIPQPEIDIRDVWNSIIQRFFSDNHQKADPETIALEHEMAANPAWPMPNAAETLETLHKRSFRLGIISNAQFYTPLMIEALFGTTLDNMGINPAIWSYQVGMAKPTPRLFERFLDEINGNEINDDVSPHEILYVGNDIRNDIHAAQSAGFSTALFAGDQSSLRLRQDDPAFLTTSPDVVLTDLTQLLMIVPEDTRSDVLQKGSCP